ncbi:hypothetical protein ACIBCH_09780 [Amycolatopsis thailandensis]|uniref:hypothetical protein n=1 Tax=Amycolatopsis thailandensis TaxID=589330 RepID=UPI00378DA194
MTGHPAYAIIHVKETPTCDAWPIVERVPGGWQSGVHHYEDERVLAVTPLYLVPDPIGVEWGLRIDGHDKPRGCTEHAAWLAAPDETPVSRVVGAWQDTTPNPPATPKETDHA